MNVTGEQEESGTGYSATDGEDKVREEEDRTRRNQCGEEAGE